MSVAVSQHKNFVGGEWVDSSGGETMEVLNPSTGEVIDVATKKILTALSDETGHEVHSEKMVEVHWKGGKVVKTGDQFGVGRVPK